MLREREQPQSDADTEIERETGKKNNRN